jgi:hypothetical protein
MDTPRLLVSGGWEFMPPTGAMPDPRILAGLTKAYGMMHYDIGLIGRFEAENLAQARVTPEPYRKTSEEASFTVLQTAAGDHIGFVRFPSLPAGEDAPSDRLIKSIGEIVKRERPALRLIVGLSDWGWSAEREYLAANPAAVPDLLLGSGTGSGVNGRIEANGRCAWVRPYDKGKTVSEIQIMVWPDREAPFAWSIPDSILPKTVGLGEQFQENPDVGAVLQ